MAKPTNYTGEYKKEIIKLVTEQGKSRKEVAKSIGVSESTIGDWIKKYSKHGENASNAHLQSGREIKYKFVNDNSSDFKVMKMCKILKIARSAYYKWLTRVPTKREIEDNLLVEKIKEIHKESYYTYGQRRIRKQLKKEGFTSSKRRVKRLMDKHGIHSRHKIKFKATTNSNHTYPIAPNLLKQNFIANKPNEKWVGDIIYIPTNEGWLYFTGVQDLFTKKVCGWGFSDRINKKLTMAAFKEAIARERPKTGLIFHSDRGSQHAAYDYQDLVRNNHVVQSMSRKGNCYDNACAESFFATLKKDIIHGKKFKTREEAKIKIIEYVETFYNYRRIHSSIGDMSPIEFESLYYNNKQIA